MFGKKKDEEIKTEEKVEATVEEKGKEVPEKEGDEKSPELPTEKVDEKVEEKSEEVEQNGEKKPDIADEEKTETAEVEETEPVGNGARIEDLVTKDELAERLAAFESKFEAVLKENADLKDQLGKMKEKYEEKDFGGFQKQGLVASDAVANDTFETYARQFEGKK